MGEGKCLGPLVSRHLSPLHPGPLPTPEGPSPLAALPRSCLQSDPGSNRPSATSYVTSGNSLPSLSLSYSICKMGTIPEPTSWGVVARVR